MKETEILEKEKTHLEEEKGYRTIHLYLMGTFLRAYNYSSFLVNRFTLKEIKIMRPGGKDDKVFAGFPQQALSNYFRQEDIENLETKEDGSVDVTLSGNLFNENDTVETLSKEYNSWHDCIPSSKGNEQSNIKNNPMSFGGIFAILKEILDYPIEKKTPIDNITFISELKTKITKIL